MRASEDERAALAEGMPSDEGETPRVVDLPFPLPGEGVTLPPSSVTDATNGLGGPSSRPGASGASQDRADASGSVLLSQVLGAAKLMGHDDVPVPELPYAVIPTEAPLRAAILAWVASTGSLVPPDELAAQLLRADALPIEIQRDLALLLFSAVAASELQRVALANIPATDLAWIYAHPEVAEQLSDGISNEDTLRMATLASMIDMEKTIAASLLMLQAVEVTRGSLANAKAAETLDLIQGADLDPTTRAMLELLVSANERVTDSAKLHLAAEIVSQGAGIRVPEAPQAPTFEEALRALLETSQQVPDAALLDETLARANALPLDLQTALAQIILAEANAIKAADPATMTPTSQTEALAAMLVAVGDALPTLEKYNLYWTSAPDALRVTEWDPAARLGWVAHHAALVLTSANDISSLSAAAAIASGHALPASATVPERSFVDAYLAIAKEGGFKVSETEIDDLRNAEAALSPAVRDAAALLMSAAAESARLQAIAFRDVSPTEREFLVHATDGLDALYGAPLSDADRARLAAATAIATRVDADALTAASIVAAQAATEALRILEGADAYRAQGSATPAKMGLAGFLQRLLPIGSAAAQVPTPTSCQITAAIFVNCVDEDVLLRIQYPSTNGFTPGEYIAYQSMAANQTDGGGSSGIMINFNSPVWTCNEIECAVYVPFSNFAGEATHDLLVITGTKDNTEHTPAKTDRLICAAQSVKAPHLPGAFQIGETGYYVSTGGLETSYEGLVPSYASCRTEEAFRYGAPTISIDLGGDDKWNMPVGMVHTNATIPVSIHLDVDGTDAYGDLSDQYDSWSPMILALGDLAGHPSVGSAIFGGVAVAIDARGDDNYVQISRSQGFGRVGFGMLADLSGTDNYEGGVFVQGASSETFSLGGGILFDAGGSDDYIARSGQGYGLGGILLDVGGKDTYINEVELLGVPVVHLDIIPGGDVTSLDERGDNRIWTSGPGSINAGLGIDQEIVLAQGQGDDDGFPDLVEFIVGTDPKSTGDSPLTNPTARAGIVREDTDGDGYPDYIERAFSTDPESGSSYPAGLPRNPAIHLPDVVVGVLKTGGLADLIGIDEDGSIDPLGDQSATGDNFTSSDKIVDLRVPLQNAGSIDMACTGEFYPNSTAPYAIPGTNASSGANVFQLSPNVLGARDPQTNGPAQNGGKVDERCVYVSYTSTGEGEGNATIPRDDGKGRDFTFHFPQGILAIGDLVSTRYADDYLVAIDLGGNDTFANSAGGGLLLTTRPRLQEGEAMGDPATTYNTFIAPSIAVSVDMPDQGALLAPRSNDVYNASERDFAQGALFGVLVDTSGRDTYVARDGSQGSLGGVLLDLGGFDTFIARHLSQGAGLASAPRRSDMSDTPTTQVPNDQVALDKGSSGIVRRDLPGILLDLSGPAALATGNLFSTSGSNSQGFARGFSQHSAESNSKALGNATRTYGILASLGEGADTYLAQTGRNVQGVGGLDGVGMLVDRAGADTYKSGHFISQGATISQTVGTRDFRYSEHVPRPAAGILVDLSGSDTYTTVRSTLTGPDRTTERQNNLTVTHAETAFGSTSTNGDARLYLDTGVHLDIEATDAFKALNGIAGGQAIGGELDAFHVHLPTARLAIGKDTPTNYAREYAFVVDLGGDNRYTYNQGGHIRDYVGELNSTPGNTNVGLAEQNAAPLNLFPLSFLLDAGTGNSTYNAAGSFAQGASYFGIGMLIDLGGRDALRADDVRVPSIGSEWVDVPPVIDGTIGDDWNNVTNKTITLVAQDDARFASNWSLRIANDKRAIYVALEGKTTSNSTAERLGDRLFVDFDMGDEGRQYVSEGGLDRTGVDQVNFSYEVLGEGRYRCVVRDEGANSHTAPLFAADNADTNRYTSPTSIRQGEITLLESACRFTEDGTVVYELRKEIINPYDDPFDLDYCYVLPDQGFGVRRADGECDLGKDRVGLMIQFNDTGAGWLGGAGTSGNLPAVAAPFVYPAGSQREDGEYGGQHNGRLDDEMTRWATVTLANLADKVAPNVTRPSTHMQGASLAGVGVVALLGNANSENELTASDRSQGYGEYSGIGLLFDVGGSDRYIGGTGVQGAAHALGVGVLADLEGNDNYRSTGRSLGWSGGMTAGRGVEGSAATAVFLDLGGDDQYVGRPDFKPYAPGAKEGQLDQLSSASTTTDNSISYQRPDAGNNVIWIQNGSVGADYKITEVIRGQIAGKLAQSLYGSNDQRTKLIVTYHKGNYTDLPPEERGPWGNGCTTQEVPKTSFDPEHDRLFDFVANGTICFVAIVDTSVDTAQNAANTVERNVPDLPKEGDPVEAQIRALLRASGANPTQGTLSVRAVDFLVDRERVTTTRAKAELNPTTTAWAQAVDLTSFQDGARRVKAMPQFIAEIEGHGAFVMYDDVQDSLNDDYPAIRTLYIDNKPVVDVDLAPRYRGAANATYSPFSVNKEVDGLRVGYSVSRDSREDRLKAATGWDAAPWNATIPCSRVPLEDYSRAQMCRQIALYLPVDGNAALTTNSGTDPMVQRPSPDEAPPVSTPVGDGPFGGPRSIVPERYDNPYGRKTITLLDEFAISLEESFHLYLAGRESISTQGTTTRIRLSIERPDTTPATTEDGVSTWYLADETRYAKPDIPADPNSVFKILSGVWDDAYEAVQENTGGGEGGDNILVKPLDDVYNDRQGCGAANPGQVPCEILHGNAMLTNTYPLCGPENPQTVPKLVRTAFQTVNGALMSAGVSVCTNLWPTLNETAETYGDLNVVGDVGDTIEPTLQMVDEEIDDALFTEDGDEPAGTRQTDLNFRDFYFEANTSLPGPVDQAAGVRHDPATNSVIIPRGYKIVFSVESQSASGGGGIAFPPPDGEETVGQAITRIFNDLGDLVQQQIEATPVEGIGQDLGAGSLAKFVADEVRRPGQNGPNIDTLTKGLGAGPSGYFLAGAGEPDLQSRLEIRSPTEPSTNVTVRIQKGIQRTTVAQLVPNAGESNYAIEGDVGYGGATRHVNLTMTCKVDDTGKIVTGGIYACSPTIWNSTWWTIHYPNEKPRVNWSSAWMPREGERWTQHNVTLDDNILADGLYAVNVSAVDATGKINWSTESLLVDRTMPRAWISTSPTIGTGGLVSGQIPLRWKVAETGSGVDKVYVFYKGGDTLSSNINQWSQPAGSPFEPSVASALIASGSQSVFLAMAIGVDEAGNVEGVTDAIDEADAVQKAFKAKIKSGLRSATNPFGVARIFIDTKDPLFSSVHSEGGRLLTYKGAEFRFIRAGAPISFSICARDDESGVNSARLALDRIDPLSGEIVTETIEAVPGDGCDTGGTLYTASSWPARNTNRTAFPEGVWIASFEVFDQGGNRLRLPFEQVILDHASPDVVVQPPVLPTGQTAVKPGDLVKIRFLAEDAFGVDDAAMRVDASSLAKNATALPTRTVRVEGTIYHEASFTVDRADLSNSAYTITVKVPDLAGNVTLATTTIKVDFKPFDFVNGTLRVSNVTHNGATLHWKTTENTSALAKYGTSLVSLTGRTPQDLNATLEHDFRVEGLKPSTHYYLRAVSVSAGGFTKESEIIEINTTSALFLDVLSPVKNDKVSGAVKVAFKGGLLDSTDFVTYTLEVRDGPTKPWTFVTTAVRQGDVHNLTWNSTRYLDGVGYELRLTAEAGRDITTRTIGPITSDNTPPNVLVLSPLLATNDTTPNITAETVDTLAGLAPTGNPIRLLLDGVPVNITPTLERTTGGRIRVHYEPTDAIPAGIHAFELQVTDLAGNVAKEIWRVAIDGDAPIVTLNPTRFAPGSAAAKLGGTVTLNLTIKDLSGVAHVVADTSGLSVTQPETRLVKLVNTDNWQGTFRVTDAAASAIRDVTIRATDLAGNTATFRVPITLDNVAPTVAATSIAATGHRRIEIDVPANEPILVNGTARAPNTEPGTAATTTAAKTAKLVFDGLFPSRTYTYTLNVVDLAGNEVPLTGKARTLDDTTPPSAIGALTYADLLNGTLRLSWAAATDDVLVSHYQVYRSEDGITFAPHATSPTPTFEDWGLPYEKSYVYKVAAVDYGGNVGPADEKLRAAATAVPHLTVGLVTPTVGTTTTTFRYTVTYASPGGVPPAYVRVILDGVPQNMTLESGEPKTGAVYVYETRLAPHKRDAPHTYAYETSDGRYTIHFPEDGSLIRGPLVSGDILADGEAGGFAAFAQRVPLGGVAGIALAMLAAVGVAALIGRRKKEGSK